MNHILSLFIILLMSLCACKPDNQTIQSSALEKESNPIRQNVIAQKSTIASRFNPPAGYERVLYSPSSFGSYLQNFELLPDGCKVHLYDGSLKWNQDMHAAILDIDVGNRDLQQCADAIMRLRAEYLFYEKKYADISFNFTNGWKFEYSSWRKGNDLIVNGNKTSWNPTQHSKETYADFHDYLRHVFMYAGTLSMSKELKKKDISDLEVGDVFIKGGSPGHAVLVVDLSIDEVSGDKTFILAQSYMPAQQIHILKNLENETISPWYKLSEIKDKLNTPEWTFDRNSLVGY